MSMGGGQTPKPVTQVNTTAPSPQQEELLRLALPFAKQAAERPMVTYGGDTVAPTSPWEIQARQDYLNQVPGVQGLAGQAKTAQSFLLDPAQLNPETNPYIRGVGDQTTRQITERLTNQILPNLRAGETAAGGAYSGGSSRELMAENFASRDAVSRMGEELNKLYFDAYRTGIGNLQTGIQQNPQVMGQQLFGADVMGAVGGQERAEKQAQLDDALRRWSLEQSMPFLRAQELYSLVGGIPGGSGTSVVTGSQPQTNPLMGALGAGASGAVIGNMVAPGIGAPVGAGLGVLAMLLSNRMAR